MDKSKILNKKIVTGIVIGVVCFGIGFSVNYLLTDISVSEPPTPDRLKLQKSIAQDIGFVSLYIDNITLEIWNQENRQWIFYTNDIPVFYDVDHFNLSNSLVVVDYWVTLLSLSEQQQDIYVKIELLWYIPAFITITDVGIIDQTFYFDSYYCHESDEGWMIYQWPGNEWAGQYNITNPTTGIEETYWLPNYHSLFTWGYYHLIPK